MVALDTNSLTVGNACLICAWDGLDCVARHSVILDGPPTTTRPTTPM